MDIGLCIQDSVAGGYEGVFFEKLPEAPSMSNKANASQLQGGPTAGQGWTHQWQW